MDQTIDYPEYCRRITLLRNCVKELILNETWEVLMVESRFRDDELQNCIGTFCECFNNPEVMFQYILKESLDFIDCGFKDENDIRCRTWWEITGYMKDPLSPFTPIPRNRKGDGLFKSLHVDVDIDGNVLDIGACSHLDDRSYWEAHPLLSSELEWKNDWYGIVAVPTCVKLPFQAGDIILCDAKPYASPFYCIYQGLEPEDEERIKQDLETRSEWAYQNGDFDRRSYCHQAIRYSGDINRLVVDDLGRYDTGCAWVPFDKMTVVSKETLHSVNEDYS